MLGVRARPPARSLTSAILLGLAAILSGCSQTALQQVMALPETQRSIEEGLGFSHLVVRRTTGFAGGPLHIYIEGDGAPFVRRDRVAPDPTPRRALMLELMAMDSADAAYVGRPCYYVLPADTCTPEYWTVARYSQAVIDSMAVVITRLWHAAGEPPLVLIGHSGGGALAVLLADALPGTHAVVTLAANLDPAAWAEHHGYTPLLQSRSPLEVFLPVTIDELHVFGMRDDNIAPGMVRAYLDDPRRQRPNFLACFVLDCRHSGCWRDRWSDVIQQILLDVASAKTCELVAGGR